MEKLATDLGAMSVSDAGVWPPKSLDDVRDPVFATYNRANPFSTEQELSVVDFLCDTLTRCVMRTAGNCVYGAPMLDGVLPKFIAAALYVLPHLDFQYIYPIDCVYTGAHPFTESVLAAYASLDSNNIRNVSRLGNDEIVRISPWGSRLARVRVTRGMRLHDNDSVDTLRYVHYDTFSSDVMETLTDLLGKGYMAFTRTSPEYEAVCKEHHHRTRERVQKHGHDSSIHYCYF